MEENRGTIEQAEHQIQNKNHRRWSVYCFGKCTTHRKSDCSKDGELELQDGRKLPQSERNVLCRCGKSNDKPFYDATQVVIKYLDK